MQLYAFSQWFIAGGYQVCFGRQHGWLPKIDLIPYWDLSV